MRYCHYKVTAQAESGRTVEAFFYSRSEREAKLDFLECYRHESYRNITAKVYRPEDYAREKNERG